MLLIKGTDVLQSYVFGEKILESSSPLNLIWWNFFIYRVCVSVHLVC